MASNGGRVPRVYRGSSWGSADGLASGEIQPTYVDGSWPAMVRLELVGPGGDSFDFTMLAEDAGRLARYLDGAASAAAERNREAQSGL